MKRSYFLVLLLMVLSVSAYAKNPVLVDSGGSGDFTTVQAAIESWCSGGANVGEASPFRIQVIGGPYDEKFSVNQSSITSPKGNIVGDLVIEATDAQVNLKLQAVSSSEGLLVYQNTANVTFKNLVFSPSVTSVTPLTYLMRLGEVSSNATQNWFNFYDCVLTEADASGNPLVTTKAQALAAGYPTNRSGRLAASTSALLVQKRGHVVSAGSSMLWNNCVFYGSQGTNVEFYISNVGEQATVYNCMNAWAMTHCWRFYDNANAKAGSIVFSGADQTEGPLNCNAVISPGGRGGTLGGTGIMLDKGSTAGPGTTVSVSNTIIQAATSNVYVNGIYTHSLITLTSVTDSIFDTPGYDLRVQPKNAVTLNNLTLHNSNTGSAGGSAILFNLSTAEVGSLLVSNIIFSGTGTKILGKMPTGGISLDYCSFVEDGPDKIGARDAGQLITYGTHNINADPRYISKDVSSASFLDVNDAAYAGAGTSGSDLAGGADYVAPPTATPTNTPVPTETYTPSSGIPVFDVYE